MKEFPPFQVPFLAWRSGDCYRHVARHWKGIGFCYLFLVFLVLFTVSNTALYFITMKYLSAGIEKCAEVGVTIKNGVLSMDKPSPQWTTFEKFDGKTGKVLFDTSGKRKTMEDAEDADLLVTPDHVRMRSENDPQGKVFTTYTGDLVLKSSEDVAKANGMLGLALLLTIGAMLVLATIGHLVLALIYSAVTMIMAAVVGAKFNYATALRLTCVAMTPAMMVSTFAMVTGQVMLVLGAWALSMPLTLGYCYFGCAAAAKTEESTAL